MWHYLPVFVDNGGERAFWILEVQINEKREVQSWNDAAPDGGSIDEIKAALYRMHNDLERFEAVHFDDVRVGLVPTVNAAYREKLKAEKAEKAKKPKKAAR